MEERDEGKKRAVFKRPAAAPRADAAPSSTVAEPGPAKAISPKAKAKACSAAPKAKAAKRPYFSVERSRSQIICKTGLGGVGSCHRIAFGDGKACRDEETAVKRARVWVAQQRKERGL